MLSLQSTSFLRSYGYLALPLLRTGTNLIGAMMRVELVVESLDYLSLSGSYIHIFLGVAKSDLLTSPEGFSGV